MTYIELIREFWKQNRVDPMPSIDTSFYFYLLDECDRRNGINPFELQSRITEISLMITRKTIGEVRNRLKQKGLIDFISGNNKPTIYRINNLDSSENNCLPNCFPRVTIKKHLREQFGNIQGNNLETFKETPSKESSPTPPKEYTPKESVDNNKYSSLRAREDAELERFDSFLQLIAEGGEQIWVEQMKIKLGINDIVEYLPSFRSHVIANAKLHEVSDIKHFERYFFVAFKYFTKSNPHEMISAYMANAKSEDFRKYCQWIRCNAPNVAGELIPLTEDEFCKLKEVYGSELIVKTILDLNNRKDLIPKYYSLFRTLKNWLKNES